MSTGERVSWFFALLGASLAVAPFVSDDYQRKLGDGAFALMLVGGLIGLTAFIVVFLLRSRNRQRRQLTAGRDLLARWNYTAAEWNAFAPLERQRVVGEKGAMLKVMAAMMLVATGVVFLLEPSAAVFVGIVLGVTWLLCWLAMRLQVRRQVKAERDPPPEVRINAHGLLIGDRLHVWSGWGNRMDACTVQTTTPPTLAITYSTPGRHSRITETVCVPIPIGHDAEAAQIQECLVGVRQAPDRTFRLQPSSE